MGLREQLQREDQVNAERGLLSSYLEKRTPEQSAALLQKAKELRMSPEQAELMTPEEDAERLTNKANIAGVQAMAPILVEKLREPNYANVVRENLGNMGLLEKAAWALSGEGGEATSLGKSASNSWSRGVNLLLTDSNKAVLIAEEINSIKATESLLAQGRTAEELFATDEDPTGNIGLLNFRGRKASLPKLERELADALALKRYEQWKQAQYPTSAVTQKFNEAGEDFGKAMGIFLDNPVQIMADLLPESMVQFAPALVGTAVATTLGAPVAVAALGTGLYSHQQDYSSQLSENLKAAGVDFSDPKKAAGQLTSETIEEAHRKASLHALPVGILDGLSLGVASKVLLPKAIAVRWAEAPVKRKFANMAVQMPIGGALGGAGEAGGQLAAEGRITSWSEVIAEVAGEHAMAPLEVASTAMEAKAETAANVRRSEQSAQIMKSLTETAEKASQSGVPSDMILQHADDVFERAGVQSLQVNARALLEAGAGKILEADLELMKKFNEAAEQGGLVDIKPSTAMQLALANPDIVYLLPFNDTPSALEAQLQNSELDEAAKREAAQVQARQDEQFKTELAEVGSEFGSQVLKATGSEEEAQSLQAVVQSFIGAASKDLGLSPKEIWQSVGASVLGELDVKRDARGNLVEVEGKNPNQWKNDAFNQSWGKFEKFKNSIVDIKDKFVGNYKDLARHLKSLSGKELKLGVSGSATLNSRGIKEIVNRPDSTRVVDENVFKTAVSNLEQLLANSVYGWSAPDRKKRENIHHVEKHFSGFIHEGAPYAARITVRVISEPKVGKKVYEVDAIEIESLDSGLNWVNQAYEKDMPLMKNASASDKASEAGIRVASEDVIADEFTLTPIAPEVQELIEVLSHLRNGSFSQASKGDFYPTLKLIARWKNADRSTLLHETGHMFLEGRMKLHEALVGKADLTPGEKHFIESNEKVLKFIGIKDLSSWRPMSHEQRRKAHEKFARSFEGWLLEGRAPKEDLVPVFAKFKEWLKKLYICLTGIPGAQFDESVQDMFSNLFLAEAQIREAKLRQNLQLMFETPEQAGMTQEEFESYRQEAEEIIANAEAEQTRRNARITEHINRIRRRAEREIKSEAKGLLKQIRDEEEAAFKETRTYKAWDKIRNGASVGAKKVPFKLTVESLQKMGATRTQIQKLREAHLAVDQKRKGQLPLDEFAANLGYDSEVSLVADLLEHLDPKSIIDERAVNRFMKENPEIATAEKIQQAANATVYNGARLKIIKLELQALAKIGRIVGKEAKEAGLQDMAVSALSEKDYKAIKPQPYINAARRAGRESQKFFAEGNVEEAFRAKSRELMQAAFAKAAKDILTARSETVDKFDNFKKPKLRGVHQETYETIQRALVNMGFFTKEKLKLNTETSLFSDIIRELEDKLGKDFSSKYEDVIEAATLGNTEFLNTPQGFTRFSNFLFDLEKAGRSEMKIESEGKKADLEQIQESVSQNIVQNAEARGREKRTDRERPGAWEKVKNGMERFGLSLARASALMAVLDGGYDGPLSQLVIHRFDKCANRNAELQHTYAEKVDKAIKPIDKELRSNKKSTSKIIEGFNFTKQDVFVMLLNYCNEGNIQRLAETIKEYYHMDILGAYDPKDSASVSAAYARADKIMSAFFAEQLDERYFTAAQKIWGVFDNVRQETAETVKRLGERTPLWVEAREFYIGKTKMTGGYYPIVYDRKASLSGAHMAAVTDEKTMAGALFSNHGVSDGHIKGRLTRFNRPLNLTAQALFSGLNEQIYFCAYSEFVNDMRKLFNPKAEIAAAIKERYGTEYYKAIDAWLRDVRENGKGKSTPYDGLANFLRKGVSVAGIGFNLAVAAIQIVGFTQSAAYLGPKWLIQGQLEALSLGMGANKWVCERSAMMRDRTRTQFREVNEIYSRLNGGSALIDKIQQAAYVPVTAMQMLVDIPTWIGGYKKALSEGFTEEQAVSMADRAVMNSQGSGRVGDLSAVERGSPWVKLFTVFYTFFNTALNMAAVSGKTEETMKAAAQIMTVCLLQPLMEYVLRELASQALGQADDKDDEDFWIKHLKGSASSVLSFDLGMLFGVREFSSVLSDYDYRGPTAMRKIVDATKAFKAGRGIIFEDKEFTESALRSFISVFGTFTGIPVSPINKAIKGYNLIEEGKSDSYFSLITGK